MPKITILHLSDLHYQRSKKDDLLIILKALYSDLHSLSEEGICPDLIIFSGDLVHNGDDLTAFREVSDVLISPLLQSTGLDSNFLFISPGNHDIQRSQINEFYLKGGTDIFRSRDSINLFLDQHFDQNEKHMLAFSQLSNFQTFLGELPSANRLTSNILFSTYCIEIQGLRIGVACLNSSWRATGGPDNVDYGKLLISERQLDRALQDIKEVDLKTLVVHHPFEWLDLVEQDDIKRRAFSDFDLLFFGHNHTPDPHLVEKPIGKAVVSKAGCLYQSRDYYNGYSVIVYDSETETGTVYLREYIDQRRAFDRALRFAKDGSIPFSIQNDSSSLKNPQPHVVTRDQHDYEVTIRDRANRNLLPFFTTSAAPKEIDKIFVEPRLARAPEHEIRTKALSENDSDDYLSKPTRPNAV